MGWLTGEQARQPTISVIRAQGTTTVKYDAVAGFLLQPGDVVQVGSLLPPGLELSPDQHSVSRERKEEGETPMWAGDTAASQGAVAGSARTLE
jgi:polysaccharide export outer membrane protein